MIAHNGTHADLTGGAASCFLLSFTQADLSKANMEEAYLKGAIFESVNMNAVSLANRKSADDFTIHVKSRSGSSEKNCCQVLTACARDLCLEVADDVVDGNYSGSEDGTDIFDEDVELTEEALWTIVFDRFSGSENDTMLDKVKDLSQDLCEIQNELKESLGVFVHILSGEKLPEPLPKSFPKDLLQNLVSALKEVKKIMSPKAAALGKRLVQSLISEVVSPGSSNLFRLL